MWLVVVGGGWLWLVVVGGGWLWLEVEAQWRWSGGGAEVVWHGVEVEWAGAPLKSTSLKRGMHAVEWSGVELLLANPENCS